MGSSAPCGMLRGSVAVSGSLAYCSTSTGKNVYAYDSELNNWSKMPECPQQFFSLVFIDRTLTAVGGFRGLSPTGALQSFVAEESSSQKKWKEVLPPMPTKRGRVAAICVGDYLVAAGGQLSVVGGRLGPGVTNSVGAMDESGYLRTVEMLNTRNQQWHSIACLPQAISDASISFCERNLYLLGGWSSSDRTKTVFTCHLQSLIRTATNPSTLASAPTNIWQKIADVPMYASSITVLYNVLVAIGGFDDEESLSDRVYSYEPSSNSWHVVSRLSSASYQAITGTLPENKLLIVGGYNSKCKSTDHVEIGSF